jgi:hypothetical protein
MADPILGHRSAIRIVERCESLQARRQARILPARDLRDLYRHNRTSSLDPSLPENLSSASNVATSIDALVPPYTVSSSR